MGLGSTIGMTHKIMPNTNPLPQIKLVLKFEGEEEAPKFASWILMKHSLIAVWTIP